MRQLNYLQSVVERDVDLLLLEELHVNERFRSWFLGRVLGPGGETAKFVDAWHSVTHETGESDLEVDVIHDRARCRVLIEDKLDADFQTNQPIRYRERAACYVSAGECARSRTVIIAPAAYLQGKAGVDEFDAKVAYETLRDWFSSDAGLGERGRYKAKVIGSAVTVARRGRQVVLDVQVTAFWDDYGRYVAAKAPELSMPPRQGRPKQSTYLSFIMNDLHPRSSMMHKLPNGQVRIYIAGMADAVARLRERLVPHLEPDMRIDAAGKSAAVWLRVPIIEVSLPMAEQMEAVAEGVAAARRLRKWAEQHHDKIGL